MTQMTERDCSPSEQVLLVAFELSNTWWKMAFGTGGPRVREKSVEARDLAGVCQAISWAKERFQLAAGAPVKSCYEAGRDGFWLHRRLEEMEVENVVVDPASINVDRRQRKKKTDRLDAQRLLRELARHARGDCDWSVVRVPTLEQEDEREPSRELRRLKKERTSHCNRMRALAIKHGVELPQGKRLLRELPEVLEAGQLPPNLSSALGHELRRVGLVNERINEINKELARRLKEPETKADEKAQALTQLRGVGATSAWVLVHEMFGWRQFDNRRQVAAAAGLTPTPHASGDMEKELGISKAGNATVRAVMIQLAWLWLRYQKDSAQSQWFEQRFGDGTSRMRRIGIVALARRLLIDFWRYVERGVVPDGAKMSPSAKRAAKAAVRPPGNAGGNRPAANDGRSV